MVSHFESHVSISRKIPENRSIRLLHGQTRYHVKSRFVDELPEAALKWLSSRQGGFGSGHVRAYQDAWARGSGLGSIVGSVYGAAIIVLLPIFLTQVPPRQGLPLSTATATYLEHMIFGGLIVFFLINEER